MSQEQILQFLIQNKGVKFLAKELKEYLDLGPSIYPNLRKLAENGRVCCEMCIDGKRYKMFRYWVKK